MPLLASHGHCAFVDFWSSMLTFALCCRMRADDVGERKSGSPVGHPEPKHSLYSGSNSRTWGSTAQCGSPATTTWAGPLAQFHDFPAWIRQIGSQCWSSLNQQNLLLLYDILINNTNCSVFSPCFISCCIPGTSSPDTFQTTAWRLYSLAILISSCRTTMGRETAES